MFSCSQRIRGEGLTFGTEPVHVCGGEEAADQRPDEDLGPHRIDTASTSKHHDPGTKPFSSGTETASNVSILQRRDFRPVYPACAQPAKGKDDLVEDDEGHGDPVRGAGLFSRRKRSDDDVHEHAEAAAESRPDHHRATSHALDVPDGRVGGDGEDGVQDAGEDAGEKRAVVEVGEHGDGEVDEHAVVDISTAVIGG